MTRTLTAYGLVWRCDGALVRTPLHPLIRNRRSDCEVIRERDGLTRRTAVVRVTLSYEAPRKRRAQG